MADDGGDSGGIFGAIVQAAAAAVPSVVQGVQAASQGNWGAFGGDMMQAGGAILESKAVGEVFGSEIGDYSKLAGAGFEAGGAGWAASQGQAPLGAPQAQRPPAQQAPVAIQPWTPPQPPAQWSPPQPAAVQPWAPPQAYGPPPAVQPWVPPYAAQPGPRPVPGQGASSSPYGPRGPRRDPGYSAPYVGGYQPGVSPGQGAMLPPSVSDAGAAGHPAIVQVAQQQVGNQFVTAEDVQMAHGYITQDPQAQAIVAAVMRDPHAAALRGRFNAAKLALLAVAARSLQTEQARLRAALDAVTAQLGGTRQQLYNAAAEAQPMASTDRVRAAVDQAVFSGRLVGLQSTGGPAYRSRAPYAVAPFPRDVRPFDPRAMQTRPRSIRPLVNCAERGQMLDAGTCPTCGGPSSVVFD